MTWVTALVLRICINGKMDDNTNSSGFSWMNYFAAFTFLTVLHPVWTEAAAFCVCRRLDKTRIISSLTVFEWRAGCCDKQLLPSLQLLFEELIWSHILPQHWHKNLQWNLYRKAISCRYRSTLETDPQSRKRFEKAGPTDQAGHKRE